MHIWCSAPPSFTFKLSGNRLCVSSAALSAAEVWWAGLCHCFISSTGARLLQNMQVKACACWEAEMQASQSPVCLDSYLRFARQRHAWLCQNYSWPTDPNICYFWSDLKYIVDIYESCVIHSVQFLLEELDLLYKIYVIHQHSAQRTGAQCLPGAQSVALPESACIPYPELSGPRQLPETSEAFQALSLPKNKQIPNLSKISEQRKFLNSLHGAAAGMRGRTQPGFCRKPLLIGHVSLTCLCYAVEQHPQMALLRIISSYRLFPFLRSGEGNKSSLYCCLSLVLVTAQKNVRWWIKHNARFQKRKRMKTLKYIMLI